MGRIRIPFERKTLHFHNGSEDRHRGDGVEVLAEFQEPGGEDEPRRHGEDSRHWEGDWGLGDSIQGPDTGMDGCIAARLEADGAKGLSFETD